MFILWRTFALTPTLYSEVCKSLLENIAQSFNTCTLEYTMKHENTVFLTRIICSKVKVYRLIL